MFLPVFWSFLRDNASLLDATAGFYRKLCSRNVPEIFRIFPPLLSEIFDFDRVLPLVSQSNLLETFNPSVFTQFQSDLNDSCVGL